MNFIRHKSGNSTALEELPSNKRGRPLLFGRELDDQVITFLKAFRTNEAPVNTAVVMACGEGIVMNYDSNLLTSNGGHITITKSWAKSLMNRIGFVKRRVTTTAKPSVEATFNECKIQFLYDVKAIRAMKEIPASLVLNWDQTAVRHVLSSNWTMEKEGSKRVEVIGSDDKRQITALFTVIMAGDFLAPQLIYQGRTKKCHPNVVFPSDWNVTHTDTH